LFDFDAKVSFDRAYEIKYSSKSPRTRSTVSMKRQFPFFDPKYANDVVTAVWNSASREIFRPNIEQIPTQHRTKTEQNYEN
jgi:hypothetical protein